eukprot:3767620-Lingulodinium_polyedra.AAC.1
MPLPRTMASTDATVVRSSALPVENASVCNMCSATAQTSTIVRATSVAFVNVLKVACVKYIIPWHEPRTLRSCPITQ